jgi:hypothetical protein
MNRYEIRSGCTAPMYPREYEGFTQITGLSGKIVETWIIYGLSFVIFRIVTGGDVTDMLFIQAAIFALIGFSLYHILIEPNVPQGRTFMERLMSDILFFGMGVITLNTLLPLANGINPSFNFQPLIVVILSMIGYHLFRVTTGLEQLSTVTKISFIIFVNYGLHLI